MKNLKGRIWLVADGFSGAKNKLLVIANHVQQKFPDKIISLLLLNSVMDSHIVFRLAGDEFIESSDDFEEMHKDLTFFFFSHRPVLENVLLLKFLEGSGKPAIILFRSIIHLSKYFETGRDDREAVLRAVKRARRFGFLLMLKVYFLAALYMPFKLMPSKKKSLVEVKKILIVKFDVFGDMVVAMPYLKQIRENFPSAEVTLMASRKGMAYVEAYSKTLNESVFDELITWNAPWHYRRVTTLGLHDFFETVNKALELRKEKYDCVMQFREHGVSVWFSRIITKGILLSIYDSRLPLSRLMADSIDKKIDVSSMDMHHMADFPKLIQQKILPGVDVDDNYLEKSAIPFFPWGGSHDTKILINLGAGMPIRQWAAEKYVGLIRRIQAQFSARPVILCGPDETLLFDEVVQFLEGSIFGHRGDLTLSEVLQLVAQADIVVTPDTGIMHLAAALNKKIVAIFGAGEVEFCRPLGCNHVIIRKELGCSGCGDACFQDSTPPPCLDLVTVDDVFSGLLSLV